MKPKIRAADGFAPSGVDNMLGKYNMMIGVFDKRLEGLTNIDDRRRAREAKENALDNLRYFYKQ